MNWVNQLFASSVGRKFAMALSAFFLIIFLVQHFTINFTSTISEDSFNQISHFMGTNPLVQFILQPILMFGVVFHFIMGFYLEFKNRSSRGSVKYFSNKASANSSWVSRNMIWSGLFILFFLAFHFYDFWIPEMNYKYVEFKPENPTRYYSEVNHMFEKPYTGRYIRVVIRFFIVTPLSWFSIFFHIRRF